MRWIVKFEGEELGSVLTGDWLTKEEICDFAGVELAETEEDWELMPENGKYCIDDLEFVCED